MSAEKCGTCGHELGSAEHYDESRRPSNDELESLMRLSLDGLLSMQITLLKLKRLRDALVPFRSTSRRERGGK